MKTSFRKISRANNLAGGIKWYLSEDCLLAAKRVMYSVEYRRFYLQDLESIVVWPSNLWIWRMAIAAVLFIPLDILFSSLVNLTTGAVFGAIGLVWITIEIVLGPTAKSRIRTTGADVDLPLVSRTRRARKVLAKIDAAVRAFRAQIEQSTSSAAATGQEAPAMQSPAETPESAPLADPTQTNAS